MRYLIYGNDLYNQEIINKLTEIGFVYDVEKPELIISVGGDGTMLNAVRNNLFRIDQVKFLGINTGKLGFYTEFLPSEIDKMVEFLKNKDYRECHFNLLEYTLINDQEQYTSYALNEIAITNPIHTQIIDVYINDIHFETFRGTGFLISTPSGSTAYNKSLQGSVVHPEVKSFQLTEIASINNRVFKTISSPLVLPKYHFVSLVSKNYENIFIVADGEREHLENIHTIKVTLSQKVAIFLTKKEDDFWIRVKKAFIE
ncbi:MAG TPA: NAD kinase [Bacilli bacterium]|nr:NAD kinase [Bacilli bacterium]